MSDNWNSATVKKAKKVCLYSYVVAILLFAGGIFTFCLWVGYMFTEASAIWKASIFGLAMLQAFIGVNVLLFAWALGLKIQSEEKD